MLSFPYPSLFALFALLPAEPHLIPSDNIRRERDYDAKTGYGVRMCIARQFVMWRAGCSARIINKLSKRRSEKKKKVDFSSSSGLRSMTIMCSINGAARARRVAYTRYINEEKKRDMNEKLKKSREFSFLYEWNEMELFAKKQLCVQLREWVEVE